MSDTHNRIIVLEKLLADARTIIVDDHYDTQHMRIWDGMEWNYLSIYAKRIHDRTQDFIERAK